MIRIGVIGLGFMGRMHLGAYQQIPNATVTAISDRSEKRAAGDLSGGWGNLEGGIEKLDMAGVTGTTDWRELIALDTVDAVDICLPTPEHEEAVHAALQAGKHVLCEKPLALSAASAQRLVDAAQAAGRILMPAMVVRFSPPYAWLRKAIKDQAYGAVRAARFHRLVAPPASGWFLDGAQSGGALLDLHVHDADMVTDLFGMPEQVSAIGKTGPSGRIDHVIAHYHYGDQGPMVHAEGGWLTVGFAFEAGFTVVFEKATAVYHTQSGSTLALHEAAGIQTIEVPGDGYLNEVADFVNAVEGEHPSAVVTAADAVASLALVEAEARSVAAQGRAESLGR